MSNDVFFDFWLQNDIQESDCIATLQYSDSYAQPMSTPTYTVQGFYMGVKFINYSIDPSTNIITLPDTENNYIEINDDINKTFKEPFPYQLYIKI